MNAKPTAIKPSQPPNAKEAKIEPRVIIAGIIRKEKVMPGETFRDLKIAAKALKSWSSGLTPT